MTCTMKYLAAFTTFNCFALFTRYNLFCTDDTWVRTKSILCFTFSFCISTPIIVLTSILFCLKSLTIRFFSIVFSFCWRIILLTWFYSTSTCTNSLWYLWLYLLVRYTHWIGNITSNLFIFWAWIYQPWYIILAALRTQ